MGAPRTAKGRAAADTRLHLRVSTLAWPDLAATLLAEDRDARVGRARHLLTLGLLAEKAGLSVAGTAGSPVLVRLGEPDGARMAVVGREDPISPTPPAAPKPAPAVARPSAQTTTQAPAPTPPPAAASPAPQVSAPATANEPQTAEVEPPPLSDAGRALLESLNIGL